ncbi:hypothetical protein F5J12DRAFT_893450 [Pisolithus orientalis]|uniref:uncharacterized protein n=1 Tax=Pisolithus orientalis TaxID=936130 RepID=UPI0022248E57|nr:uncharacterized protein F5J12DRAFT_893450 [Pisolithus orientalis]KAI6004360.1 hypothetical protein F5J12DRAFT_893450 [Pisolithus orientalis]
MTLLHLQHLHWEISKTVHGQFMLPCQISASCAKFFFSGTTGDVTIVKGDSDNVTELVLSGILEINHQGFFMAPEGGYNPRNAFGHKFSETKLTCNLLTMQHDAVYSFTQQDFPHIISNIRSLEKLMPLEKGETLLSSIQESHDMPCIHLSHALFTKKDNDNDPDSITQNEDATAVWLMLDDIKDMLSHATSTHYISSLPAFDIHGMPILPVDYAQLLSGAHPACPHSVVTLSHNTWAACAPKHQHSYRP